MSKTLDDLQQTDISQSLREEIALFRVLKPYLGHCLTMNHDLNNPLSGVLGYAEYILMDDDKLTEDQKANLQQIVKCAERMRELINHLCEEKIALTENIDLSKVTEAYKAVAKPLPIDSSD